MKKIKLSAILLLVTQLCMGQISFPTPLKDNPIERQSKASSLHVETPSFRGASLFETLNQTFDSIFTLTGYVGLNAALRLPDGSVWKRAKGTNVDFPNTSLQTDDPIGMGSITKTMVATLMLLLEEDSLLSLDDKISVHLPPINNVNPNITIRQLLNHTSGLYNYTDHPRYGDTLTVDMTRTLPVSTIFQFINAPYFPPGTSWRYSNTNYVLAGLIIEAVTGKPYYTELRNRIIAPLGMSQSFTSPHEPNPGRPMANLWADINDDGFPEDIFLLIPNINAYFSTAAAAGAVVSTPSDLTLFMQKLFGGEILSPASLTKMQNFILLDPDLGLGYGLGAIRIQDPLVGKRSWGHGGNILYQSEAYHYPDLNVAVAVQTNDASVYLNKPDLSDAYRALILSYCAYIQSSSAGTMPTQEKWLVWPNPTRDRVFVGLDSGLYQLWNSSGSLVKSGEPELTGTISMEDVRAGMYFLQLKTKNGVKVSKIVKE